MKNENLLKQTMWNPWIAVCENGKAYELENIKIYTENGVIIETGRGWFGSNNNLGNRKIDRIYLKRTIDLKSKKNFIIKEEKKSYRLENRYTLYIYYKDVLLNFNFIAFELNNFWLEAAFTVFDNYKDSIVLGSRQKESDSIKYNKELEEAFKKIDNYNFQQHYDEVKKAMESIENYHRLYEDQKTKEKSYTLKDYKKMVYSKNECIDPLELISNIEKTYNIKIEGNN